MASKLNDLSKFEFIDSNKKEQNLSEFLNPEDYWEKTGFIYKDGKRKKGIVGIFVKHAAVQRLAAATGIELINLELLVGPIASNEQEHTFGANFQSYNRQVTHAIGESSIRNCRSGVARDYLSSVAYKRLFDRGVLSHLGFYELYSAEEAEEFDRDAVNTAMETKDFEPIKDILDLFVNSKTVEDLDRAKQVALDRKKELNPAQINHVLFMYKNYLADLELSVDTLDVKTTPTTTPEPSELVKARQQPVKEPTALELKVAASNAKLEAEAQKSETKIADQNIVDPLAV